MTTNVDLEKLQKDAVDIFNQGFACSESVHGDLEEADVSAARLPEQPCASATFSDVRHREILR